jgi:general secretion pathway protein K
MKRAHFIRRTRQRGVAVVTALLLTTLAITIVASLFWQQQVQVRSIENQRLQLQKQWILRGALDWVRLILREDARHSTADHLGEPWAVPLAETRLDDYVENGQASSEPSEATLSGGIYDAQGRFNITNLCPNGQIDRKQVAVFERLLTNARLDPELAMQTANLMASSQAQVQTTQATQTGGASATTTTGAGTDSSLPLNILNVDDLLAVPGFTPEALNKIRDLIVVLPVATAINVNTAPAEVLAAGIDTLSLSDAAALVASRERAWFRDMPDFTQRLQAQGKQLPSGISLATTTNYFLVIGNVRLSRAGMQMQALIQRNGPNTKVLWVHQG